MESNDEIWFKDIRMKTCIECKTFQYLIIFRNTELHFYIQLLIY